MLCGRGLADPMEKMSLQGIGRREHSLGESLIDNTSYVVWDESFTGINNSHLC
jgi:ABC-type lipopolysaccharide export system ATPase subunit